MENYTDYELMCWLNENGYEPSLENVEILKESDKLERLRQEESDENTRRSRHLGKRAWDTDKYNRYDTIRNVEDERDKTIKDAEEIKKSTRYGGLRKAADKVGAALTIRKDKKDKKLRDIADKENIASTGERLAATKVAKHNEDVRDTKFLLKHSTYENEDKKPIDINVDGNERTGEITYGKPYKLGKLEFGRERYMPVRESSDYELMCWLDENGYEPTKENVEILREEINNKTIYNSETELVNEVDVKEVLVEEISDFELMCWLNENGYEPTKENVEILREEYLTEAPKDLTPEQKAERSKLAQNIFNARKQAGDRRNTNEFKNAVHREIGLLNREQGNTYGALKSHFKEVMTDDDSTKKEVKDAQKNLNALPTGKLKKKVTATTGEGDEIRTKNLKKLANTQEFGGK